MPTAARRYLTVLAGLHVNATLLCLVAALIGVAGCAGPADPTSRPATSSTATSTAAPVRVDVASIGAHSTLTQVDLNAAHQLDVPPVSQPQQAAWYRRSEPAGADGGIPTIIVGHINGDGHPGVFSQLADQRAGAEVDVARSDGTTAVFTVDHVDVVPKAEFPTAAVYSAAPGAALRLISCGGDLDVTAHNYTSQVLAFAHLTGTHRT